jgi:hypothetical protein
MALNQGQPAPPRLEGAERDPTRSAGPGDFGGFEFGRLGFCFGDFGEFVFGLFGSCFSHRRRRRDCLRPHGLRNGPRLHLDLGTDT